ncbi:amino acid ABC transporter substrate-binding protein [Rhodospirillaceae bacterium KN72]|uniref:Amino acid ABC transporter substrate-binding protein n=1 Tax=Pacificispira spongiicola TaxID=2729598 RepID=A0A7Y0DX31_9PROT|nr:transporter substrate-binding domain-containing protein [Pacificispira spongiicola]NMM43195.1 amino acid ABC transporter substrate-binding protein [Pacificispira spongiicola]
MLLWTAAAVTVSPVPAAKAQPETFLVAVNDAPPYRIIETDGNGQTRFSGFYIDVAREMARRLDISLRFVDTPFRRALAMMLTGEADMMLGPNRTAERETFMVYVEEPLPSEPKSFYRMAGKPDIARYEDLAGRIIGVQRKAAYFDPFDTDEALTKFPVGDYEGAFKMMVNGRLDTVIAPTLLGDYLISRLGLPIVRSTFTAGGRPSYFAISHFSTADDRAPQFAAVLAEMKADGTMARIEARYRGQ